MNIYHIEKDVLKIYDIIKKLNKNFYRFFPHKKTEYGEKIYKTIKNNIFSSLILKKAFNNAKIIIGEVVPSYNQFDNIVYLGYNIYNILEENGLSLFCQIYHELTHLIDNYYYEKLFDDYYAFEEDYKYFSELELRALVHEFYAIKFLLKKEFYLIGSVNKLKRINYNITTTLYYLSSLNKKMYKNYYLVKLFYYLEKNKIYLNENLKKDIVHIDRNVTQIALD